MSSQLALRTCSVTAARGNSVDDYAIRGRPKCRFSTTGTGNSSGSDNYSSCTGTYCRSRAPPYHWTFGGNCAVFSRRLLHGTARHAPAYWPLVVTINQPFPPQFQPGSPYFYTSHLAKFGVYWRSQKSGATALSS